jgi:hypothetical protein
MKKLRHESDYRKRRAVDYPMTGDALDAIAKGFRALLNQGLTLPADTLAWVERCERVKARITKPND